MIKLNRLSNEPVMINSDMIEYIEEKPNTMISLLSGRKIIVLETAEEIRDLVIDYKRRIYSDGPQVKA